MAVVMTYGCRQTKEVIDVMDEMNQSSHAKIESSSEKQIESQNQIKDITTINDIGETIIKTVETDFDTITDPNTGCRNIVPTHQKITIEQHKKNKTSRYDTNINSHIEEKENNKQVINSCKKQSNRLKVSKSTESKSNVKYIRDSLVIVALLGLIVLLLKYKSHILTALKCMIKSIKKLLT